MPPKTPSRGNLLPSRYPLSDNVASGLSKQAVSWVSVTVSPTDISAYLFHILLRVNIR